MQAPELPTATEPKRMRLCRGLKETTGIVGVEVDPEARSNLLSASQAVLASVAEKIPAEAQYRSNVEATFEHWIEQVPSHTVAHAGCATEVTRIFTNCHHI